MTIDREVFEAMCLTANIGTQLKIKLPSYHAIADHLDFEQRSQRVVADDDALTRQLVDRSRWPSGYVTVDGPKPDENTIQRQEAWDALTRTVVGEPATLSKIGDLMLGFDPAKPGSDKTALVIYDGDRTQPATQAGIDRLQARVNELFKQVCDQQWAVHDELMSLRRMVEDANDGKPLWFQKPIKGDVLSGHQWDGHDWQRLQMVEPDLEIDRIWDAVKAASRA